MNQSNERKVDDQYYEMEQAVKDNDKTITLVRPHGYQDKKSNWQTNKEDDSDRFFEDRNLGKILVDQGKIESTDIERILDCQEEKSLFFGDAARHLKLVSEDDIKFALALQFGYPTAHPAKGIFSDELVAAYDPFGKQAEIFRTIRTQLSMSLNDETKVLTVVSPSEHEGRSYVAANLAVTFSQMSKQTLLIDANLRKPRQNKIFGSTTRVGLSSMLSGRIRQGELDLLPEPVPFFTHLSVLGAGAVPPNPVELFSNSRFQSILDEVKKFFDVIIIDSPAGLYRADVQMLCSCAQSALVVARQDHTKLSDLKDLSQLLTSMKVNVVGSIMNRF